LPKPNTRTKETQNPLREVTGAHGSADPLEEIGEEGSPLHYPNGETGRPPYPLLVMLRIHWMWFLTLRFREPRPRFNKFGASPFPHV